ncbi:MAG: hypothetical protein EOM21_15835 [Gammaproteobacteria bacterium]|nr:hypothetical protein [Gammaproteobacteria bacterium]
MLDKLIVFVEEYSMEAALEQLLQKLLGTVDFQLARSVAGHMDVQRNRSRSFHAFIAAVTAAMV